MSNGYYPLQKSTVKGSGLKGIREGSEPCASNVIKWISLCSACTFPSTPKVVPQKKNIESSEGSRSEIPCSPTGSLRGAV